MAPPAMVIGHDDAVRRFLDAGSSGRIHHAWLLAGPQGIGKATLAEAAARWLLAEAAGPVVSPDSLEVDPGHPVATLIAAGSHPDYKRLDRLAKPGSEDLARSITVDQVRSLQPLFATTPSLSHRRVVLIDAIDDLERSAANALLKNLEEPPAGTIFLLVSHAPGRLLPTIRSRCRLLPFQPLSEKDVRAVLRGLLPTSDAGELDHLVHGSRGSPGAALRFAGLDIGSIDAAIEKLATQGDASNALRTALGRSLSSRSAQPRYEAFLERAPARLAAAARAGGDMMAPSVGLWRQARDIADRAVRQSLDPHLTVVEIAGLLAELAPGAGAAKG